MSLHLLRRVVAPRLCFSAVFGLASARPNPQPDPAAACNKRPRPPAHFALTGQQRDRAQLGWALRPCMQHLQQLLRPLTRDSRRLLRNRSRTCRQRRHGSRRRGQRCAHISQVQRGTVSKALPCCLHRDWHGTCCHVHAIRLRMCTEHRGQLKSGVRQGEAALQSNDQAACC